jgi:hypothetical protein
LKKHLGYFFHPINIISPIPALKAPNNLVCKFSFNTLTVTGNSASNLTGVSNVDGDTGADYAECLEKSDPNEGFTAGQIVGVHGGKITKVTEGADQVLPVSLAPAVLGNMPPDNEKDLYEKIGFMGQVPVLIWGKAKVGQILTKTIG